MAVAIQENMQDVLERVVTKGERVMLHQDGKGVAALVSLEDLALLEELEDRLDNEEADKALAEMEATGAKPIPIEAIMQRLGIE